MNDRGSDWTREESRFVDGELEGEAPQRIEQALGHDPERRERLGAWTQAMDLWREDAELVAGRLDRASLADRILSDLDPEVLRSGRAASRYAAAALLILGLGVAGSFALGPHPARAAMLEKGVALRVLEEDRLHHHGRIEWERRSFVDQHFEDRER